MSNEQITAMEEENSFGTYVHHFKTPFEHSGKTYEVLTFKWDAMTGRDALAIEHEMMEQRLPLIAPQFSADYLIRMAARACTENIGIDVIQDMPIADFNKIKGQARSFLLMSE